MLNLDKLERELRAEKQRLGLLSGSLNLISHDGQSMAMIEENDWDITIGLNKDKSVPNDSTTEEYLDKRDIERPLEELAFSLLRHEVGHWELPSGTGNGCPYDIYYADLIEEGIVEGLKNVNSSADVPSLKNMYADVAVNTNARYFMEEQGGHFGGQLLFWQEQGELKDKGYSMAYETFVKTNLELWGDELDNKLIQRYYTDQKQVNEALSDILDGWGVPGDTADDNQPFMMKKDDWQRQARIFAEEIGPLMEQEEMKENLFGTGENNPDKKAGARTGRKKISFKRYKKGASGSKNTRAQHISDFQQLDELYSRFADLMGIEAEGKTAKTELPVADYGKRAFDPEEDSLKRKNIKGLTLDKDGDLTLAVNKRDITVPGPYQKRDNKLPKIMIGMLDNSGSMRENPVTRKYVKRKNFIPWGDNSKYHYALKGVYSIFNYLDQQDYLPEIDLRMLTFSSDTRYARSAPGERLLPIKKEVLNPEFGDTQLDMDVVKQALEEDSLIVTVGDGGIQNWSKIRDEYRSLIENTQYSHIQIGEENNFSKDLESWGAPVNYVKGDDDLSYLLLKTSKAVY